MCIAMSPMSSEEALPIHFGGGGVGRRGVVGKGRSGGRRSQQGPECGGGRGPKTKGSSVRE